MHPTMEQSTCNVIYLDRRAEEEIVRRDNIQKSLASRRGGALSTSPNYFRIPKPGEGEIQRNLETLLSIFREVHVVNSGAACLSKISDLSQYAIDNRPTIVLIDVPHDEEQRMKRLSREPRTPSPTAARHGAAVVEPEMPGDIYGMYLLIHVASEVQQHRLSKLIVPVVVVSGLDRAWVPSDLPTPSVQGSHALQDTHRLLRYLDAGAVDVYSSPLSRDHVHSLAVHAYRVHKEVAKDEPTFLINRRSRKMSWVGVNEQKPYAYLREAMVSGLLNGICNPETVADSIDPNDVDIVSARYQAVTEAVGSWSFSAHDFNDDELVHGAVAMLSHALTVPELQDWHMDTDELTIFLLASRRAYNEFVLYHNFRHAVDVLQAVFTFLVQIGTLPPYPSGSKPDSGTPSSAIGRLLKPFDALTLLISAIGHDVGHPGVNNAFLVALNAPLAQLYNDRSVLESFHCAAFSQILRRYWPSVFSDIAMRKLMISNILATDMGLHFKYMSDLGNLQQKLAHNGFTTDGWSAKVCEEYKDLACGLLIKCADICNVARKFHVAAQWATILTDEFSHQGMMEGELGIPTCLFGGPPDRSNPIKMAESQIGFMNIFARPLFEAVTDILPAMRFAVDQILDNKKVWEKRIEFHKEKMAERRGRRDIMGVRSLDRRSLEGGNGTASGAVSPRSGSHVDTNRKRDSHPGSDPVSPASATSPTQPTRISLPNSESRRSSGANADPKSSRRSSGLRTAENTVQEGFGSGEAAASLSTHPQAQPTIETPATKPRSRSSSPTKRTNPCAKDIDTPSAPSADDEKSSDAPKTDSIHLAPSTVNGVLDPAPVTGDVPRDEIPRQGVVNTDEEQGDSCCVSPAAAVSGRRRSEKPRSSGGGSRWRRDKDEGEEKSPATNLTPVTSRSSSTPNILRDSSSPLERTTSVGEEGREGSAQGRGSSGGGSGKSRFGLRFWRRKWKGEGEQREGSPVQEGQRGERIEEGAAA